MDRYLYFCPVCLHRYSSDRMDETTCRNCGGEARRDWKAESVSNHFHPTVDLYGKRVEQRAKREDRF
jgi:hypothetical protein